VYRHGTIASRINDLLKSGVMKERPLWLDVYEHYPPLTPMKWNEPAHPGKPPHIRYKKDILIKLFNNHFMQPKDSISLLEDHNELTMVEKFVNIQTDLLTGKDYTSANITETFEKAKEIFEKTHSVKLKPKMT
jgi:hypothetical protein